ncbi:MAG: sulfurtransferase [Caldilineales bacterium]|nr:sulfurtransferase [Caldilineales bacterium]
MYNTLITTSELAELLDRNACVLVDCRFSLKDATVGQKNYLASHIPGAVFAHLDDDLCGPIIPGVTGRHPLPDVDDFVRKLSGRGIDETTQVVCYDDAGGGFAVRLWWMLRWLGHDGVAILDGGWQAWINEGRATQSGWETRAPSDFKPHPRLDLVFDADQVEAVRLDPNWRVIDAREAIRYQGLAEPIDPVAGRIPGAVNAPWKDNLTDGRFLDADALREIYQPLIADMPPEQVVVYCGSGVTACHDIFAIAHAGLGDVRLYAGSWSDWITDPNRPIASDA